MKNEFKIAKGWAIFIWIFAPGLIALFGFLGVMPYTEEKFDLTLALILTPISLGMIFLMVLGVIDTIKSKLIIDKTQLISISVFKTKRLDFKDIKGIKSDQNYLHFIPNSTDLKKIKVSTYVGKYSQLANWANSTFKNLDFEEIAQDTADILENVEYGRNTEEREYKLESTRKKTKILNTISLIIGLGTLFFPHFYKVQIITCAILPILGLILLKSSKGLIKLDDTPNSAHPNLLGTLFTPSAALMIRAIMDFNVFNYEKFWKPALLLFASLTFLLFFKSEVKYNFKKVVSYLAILGMLMFGSMYAYGFLITTNVIFDNSNPNTYKAKVIDKHISSGKSTTYYLKLDSWGPQTEIEDVSVSKQIYKTKEIGDSAIVYFNNGLFEIPYYLIIE